MSLNDKQIVDGLGHFIGNHVGAILFSLNEKEVDWTSIATRFDVLEKGLTEEVRDTISEDHNGLVSRRDVDQLVHLLADDTHDTPRDDPMNIR